MDKRRGRGLSGVPATGFGGRVRPEIVGIESGPRPLNGVEYLLTKALTRREGARACLLMMRKTLVCINKSVAISDIPNQLERGPSARLVR